MFLTTVNCKTILVQMVSAAGTGYFFNTKRNRLREKLVLLSPRCQKQRLVETVG
uniref:39S ribosomal protein L33, mitochondrial n=1 Tax=Myripristis murdjan TaxID=586833 RepID=A0A667Z1A4_9TELE